MVRVAAVLLLIGAALAMAGTANAADMEYYIELGDQSGEEAAMRQWRSLSEKYQDILAGLRFTPRTVLRMDNTVATRLEVGPLDRKARAEEICARLFADHTPCFILEGEKLPPEERAASPEAAAPVSLPWLTETSAAPAEPEPEARGFFAWLFGDDPSMIAKARPDSALAKAEVEVAEAIRVPLSDKPLPAEEIAPPPQIRPVFQSASGEDTGPPGWLNIYAFAGEDSADAFWQDVRAADPARAAGLRVRIVSPMARRGGRGVSLNIGPFPGRATAEAFCRGSIEPVNRDLTCRFEQNEPQAESRLVTPRYRHNERYRERRRQLRLQRDESYASSMLSKVYWVQVVSAADQSEALNAWKTLRAENADLLEGLRTRIATSLMRQSGYIVRVGPLHTGTDAAKLCASLKERGVDCRVYSN